MQLGRFTADRGDADRVLEQAARVAVVAVGRRRQRAQRGTERVIGEQAPDSRLQPGVRDLTCQELEEAVERVRVTPERRGERGRIGLRGGLERGPLDL